jgi:uncharacterized protein (TIGR00645 family)
MAIASFCGLCWQTIECGDRGKGPRPIDAGAISIDRRSTARRAAANRICMRNRGNPMAKQTPPQAPVAGHHKILATLIFGSRWLQVPLYLGLIVAQCVYVLLFLKELWHLITHATTFSEQQIMLIVLALIDVVMISNLLIMVIVGGYETFVSRLRLEDHPDQPEWLDHVNASVLKIKLAMAIIGISSIHLLKTFIEAGNLGKPGAKITDQAILWQTTIHVVFILSAIGIAYIDRMGQPVARGDGGPPSKKP